MVMHWRSRVQFELDNAEPDADYNQRSLEGNSRLALGMLELAEALRRRYGGGSEPPVVHRETKLRPAVLASSSGRIKNALRHLRMPDQFGAATSLDDHLPVLPQ